MNVPESIILVIVLSDVANLYTHLAKEVVREDKWRRGDRWKSMNNEMCARTAQEDRALFHKIGFYRNLK